MFLQSSPMTPAQLRKTLLTFDGSSTDVLEPIAAECRDAANPRLIATLIELVDTDDPPHLQAAGTWLLRRCTTAETLVPHAGRLVTLLPSCRHWAAPAPPPTPRPRRGHAAARTSRALTCRAGKLPGGQHRPPEHLRPSLGDRSARAPGRPSPAPPRPHRSPHHRCPAQRRGLNQGPPESGAKGRRPRLAALNRGIQHDCHLPRSQRGRCHEALRMRCRDDHDPRAPTGLEDSATSPGGTGRALFRFAS